MPVALQMLKSDPEKAFGKYVYMTKNSTLSGACGIDFAKVGGNVYSLAPDFDKSGHYFFKYGRMSEAPGRVLVPPGQPDGTIVFTGGMNGCALQVQRTADGFMFYHDVNKEQMTGAEPGTTVCRVEPEDYDKLKRGLSVSREINQGGKYEGYFQFAIVTVHHAGRWKVFANCIITETDVRNGRVRRAYKITTAPTTFMTSFDDS